MYNTLLATPTGQFIQAQISEPRMITRMTELSNHGLPAVGALTETLPANLANRYKRLAGYLVRRVMHAYGYALVPGRSSRISGSSLFKTGACYRPRGKDLNLYSFSVVTESREGSVFVPPPGSAARS